MMNNASHAARRLTMVLVAVTGLVLAAEAEASDDSEEEASEAEAVFERFNAMSEPQRTEELIEAAQAEGQLNLYGTSSLGDFGEAFSEKYDIEFSLYEADTDAVTARIVQEADAGRYVADYLDGGATHLQVLDELGLLGHYESPIREQVPAEGTGENWTGYRRQPFVAAYNTDVVSPDDIPDDYLDFADPQWEGLISMELGDYDWYMGLVTYYEDQGMSREAIDEALSGIASNAQIATGHSDQAQLLAAGQFGVTMSSYVHHIDELEADGAPVTWGGNGEPTVQPIIMRYEGTGILRHAPHPAAALLFMDFVLGPDGAELVLAERQLPAVPADDDPLEGLETVLIDLEEYINNGDEWARAYDELLRNAR